LSTACHLNPEPVRLKPLHDLPAPINRRELQHVVGMFAYYAKCLPNLSEKTRPLMLATLFAQSDDVATTFKRLKKGLSKVCLGSIDENASFTKKCDASIFAIAAVLNQKSRPVAFTSRTHSRSECNYSSVEKEAFSFIEAVS